MTSSHPQHSHEEEFWGDTAQWYLDAVEPLSLGTLRAVLVPLQLGAEPVRLLEVGAGPGISVVDLATQSSPNSSLTITDFSPAAVEMAQRRVGSNKVASCVLEQKSISVDFLQVSGEDLSRFEDGSFDRYLACMALHHIPDEKKAVREARRVLAPGGIAMFVEKTDGEASFFSSVMEAMSEMGLHNHSHQKPHGASPNYKRMLLDAGFSRVLTWTHMGVSHFTDARSFAVAQSKPSPLNAAVPADRLEEFREKLTDAAERRLGQGQPLGLAVQCLLAFA